MEVAEAPGKAIQVCVELSVEPVEIGQKKNLGETEGLAQQIVGPEVLLPDEDAQERRI